MDHLLQDDTLKGLNKIERIPEVGFGSTEKGSRRGLRNLTSHKQEMVS